MSERVDAKKERRGPDEALELARSAVRVRIAKGKKILEFDMRKDPPPDDLLLGGMIGPSGNLRAPTIVAGGTLLVGFHPEAYREVFG